MLLFCSFAVLLSSNTGVSSAENTVSQGGGTLAKISDIPDVFLEYYQGRNEFGGRIFNSTSLTQQQIDLEDYFTNIPSNAGIKIGVTERTTPITGDNTAYVIQLCTTNDGCDSSDYANHFDGADKEFSNHYFGGTLPAGTTSFWIRKHRNVGDNFDTRTIRVEITTPAPSSMTLSDEFQVVFKEIGFLSEHTLSFEPRKGKLDQVLIRWPNPLRYQPDGNGVVITTAEASGLSDPVPPYSVYFNDKEVIHFNDITTFRNAQIPLVVPDHYVTTDSEGYVAYTTHTIEPDLERFARISYIETRHGINYHITSEPVAFYTPNALTAQKQTNNDFIQISWTDTYTDTTDQTPNIDQWQYRIGHTPGTDTPEQTGFTLQPTWTTTQWTTICTTDLTTETNNNQNTHTHLIKGPGTHPTNNCGPDTTQGLPQGHQYIIQLKGNDQNRNPTPQVRNLITTQPINIPAPTPTPTTPPPATNPTTHPTTHPTTQPTTPTNPTTPNTSSPTTQPTATNPTNPDNTTPTTPTTPTPSTQPSATPTGGIPPAAPSANNPPESTDTEQPNTTRFTDTIGHTHEQNIGQLADMGVTRGCNPPENSRFCPDRAVTRAEMATFLTRAFNLNPTDQDPFTDTTGNIHRTNINRLAAAGISRGCNPPTNTRFCPNRAVTRAEMATFMTRVLELEEEGTGFDDTQGNIHATNIRRFAEAGITRGCNPPSNTRYCPDRAVTRAEMATFLVRSTALNTS